MNIKELKEYIKDLPDDMEIAYMDFWRKEKPYFRIHNNELTVE
jgi:hypothetical protein